MKLTCAGGLITGRGWMGIALGASAVAVALTGCSEPAPAPVETPYLISLNEAGKLGMQVAWQSAMGVTQGGRITQVYPFDDLLVTIEDGANVLSAVRASDGVPQWDLPIGDSLERTLGVMRSGDTLYVATQSETHFVDSVSGRVVHQESLGTGNVASTGPLLLGSYFVYGTENGRIVYHNLGTGMAQDSYRLDSAVARAPQEAGGGMLVQTISGKLHFFDPAINSRIWVNQPLDPFESRPAVSDRSVFVAGADQSVWCFRLADGRQMWRARFDAPLRDDPTFNDGVVYQSVPGTGLVAIDAANGSVLWKNPEITGGTVVTTNRGNLIVWDQADAPARRGGTFYRVDRGDGRTIGKASSDLIWLVTADRPIEGNIYALSKPGLVTKLIP